MPRAFTLHINGASHDVTGDAERSLLSVLRDELHLTGTKYGCGEGQCGACTVLLGDRAVRSCVLPIGSVDAAITTIEGLETGGRLHPVQEAFVAAQAMQCGYCTSGMIMSACALLREKGTPNDADIVRAMNGNICRCGTYPRIVQAIHSAAQTSGGAR